MTRLQRNSLLVSAGLIAALVGLVANFPARLALSWFAPSPIQAWGAEGTVWNGRAVEIALDGHGLGGLGWEAHGRSLLALRPTWDLVLRRSEGFAQATVVISLLGDRQVIRDLDAALELSTLPPAIVPIGVTGRARIALQRLEFERGWPTVIVGQADVGEMELPGVILPLGPFEFRFAERTGGPLGEIRSTGGPLRVDGRIELPERGRWHFSAELAPGEDAPRELVEGLQFVGEDIGGGRRRLEMSSHP
jgi:general secretion pathway protein N